MRMSRTATVPNRKWMRDRIVLLVLPLVMSAGACKCYAVSVEKAADGVTLVKPAGPSTQFTRQINFGPVRISDVADAPIELQNVGRTQVTITATLTAPNPNLFYLKMPSGDSNTVVMPAGSTLDMDLRYLPTMVDAPMSDTATIVITTTATSTPKYTIDVTGNGAQSQIDVCSTDGAGNPICASMNAATYQMAGQVQLTVDMGGVVPGMSAQKSLIIKDLGGLTLSVASITPTMSTTAEWTVTPNAGPVTVDTMAQSMGYQFNYAPLYGGNESGEFQFQSDDPTNPVLIVQLTGIGDAPALCYSPSPTMGIEFGPTGIGMPVNQTLTITSCGTQPAIISSFTLDTGEGPLPAMTPAAVFSYQGAAPTLPVTLQPMATLPVPLTFNPTAIGDFNGHLTVVSNAPQGHGVILLDGQGVACSLTAPASVNFGSVPTGGSATQPVVVTNSGTNTCNISSAATSGAPFTLTNPPTMTVTIQPGQSTSLSVEYQPTTTGSAMGTLTVMSDAQGGPVVVRLIATGIAPPPCLLVASPNAVAFSGVSVGQTVSDMVTLTNEGTDTCDIVQASIDPVNGAPTTDFTDTLNPAPMIAGAPTSVAPGGTVMLKVSFKPTTSNNQNVIAEVDYYDDNAAASGCMFCALLGMCNSATSGCLRLQIPVSATTLTPKICVDPASLNFMTVAPGQTKVLGFQITSCGMGALTVNGIKMEAGSSSTFTIVPPNVTVPKVLQPGQSATVNVQYAPTTTNGDFGQVAVMSNDPTTPKVEVPVQGNAGAVCASQLSCSVPKLVFATMTIGQTASLSLTCLNVGTSAVTITGYSFGATSSAAFTATVGATPETIQPGQSARVQVDYSPQTAGTDDGTITITSNSCQTPSVALEGSGIVPNYPPCLPPQTFTPLTKWYWPSGLPSGTNINTPTSTNVQVTPLVANLVDSNGDGMINQNDVPDVIFTSCATGACSSLSLTSSSGSDISGIGMVRAIYGATGMPLWDVTGSNLQVPAETQLATADLDGDNLPEIVACQHNFTPSSSMSGLSGHYVTGVLEIFDHTGHLEFLSQPWTGDPNDSEVANSIAIADIDGDGFPEIAYAKTIFNYDGTVRFNLPASGSWGFGEYPILEDVNGDGVPDILLGAYLYNNQGSLIWRAGSTTTACDPTQLINACVTSGLACDPVTSTCMMSSGPEMVLGLTVGGTLKPVVVLRDGSQSLRLLDGKTGTLMASATWPVIPSSGTGSGSNDNSICPAPSSAADLDGDGEPEFIIPAGNFLYTFKYDGTSTLKQFWKYPINDYGGQCGAAGSAAFDFNGDGKADVVYHDTEHIYVLNGPDGALEYEAPRSSDTIFETPVIADIDHSGHASFLMTNDEDDTINAGPAAAGVKALSNTGNNWPETRGIWSDHAYHVSEITDGDTVPRVEVPSWKGTNTWRSNPTLCTPHP